jgi:hypothetical protein
MMERSKESSEGCSGDDQTRLLPETTGMVMTDFSDGLCCRD